MSALPAVEIRSDIQAPASAPHPGVISKTALPLTSPRRRFHKAGVLRSCQKSGSAQGSVDDRVLGRRRVAPVDLAILLLV